MGRSGLDAVNDNSVRSRILVATIEIVAADGLDAVRHRRVASRAGVSLGSTSYHFASREDLVAEAFRFYLRAASRFLDDLQAELADRSPRDLLVEQAVELIDREFGHPALVLAEYELILYAARHPALADDLQEWEAQQRRALTAAFRAAGAADPESAAAALLAVVRGFEVERLITPTGAQRPRGPIGAIVDALIG